MRHKSNFLLNDTAYKSNLQKDNKVICPFCKKSYYYEQYSITTAAYFPTIIKNGKVVSTGKNKITVYYKCMNCGKEFSIEK